MSLSINTNLPALTALENLDTVNSQLATNVNRLSSGLNFSSAGENPSGAVLSQKFQAEIAGMSQAISNSQTALNMTQTASSGLDQIENILQSMRSIAVASANVATESAGAVQANQQQMSSSIQSIDQIVQSTTWAGQNLLDGTAGIQAAVSATNDVTGVYMSGSASGKPVASGPVTIQLTSVAAQTSLTTNQTFTGLAAIVPQGAFSINGLTFTSDGSSTTVQGLMNEINSQGQQTGVQATAVASGSNVAIQLTSEAYGSQFPINLYDSGHILDTSTSPAPTVPGANAVASVTIPVTTATGPSTINETFTGGSGPTGSGLELTDSSGNRITLSPTGNNSNDLSSATGIGVITTGSMQFQIGASGGQSVSVDIPNVSTNQLGTSVTPGQSLANVNVTNAQGAQLAIQTIDAAISQVAALQANIGAIQAQQIQPNISLLQNASVNLSSANSNVSDVNIASEMTSYTMNQVLEQSGLAILAQANSNPQQILQLLRQ